jgi:predicted MPP superfamily phosphohydrolase
MVKVIYFMIGFVAISILFFAHFYIYTRILKLFKINKILLIFILSFLTLSFILMSIIVRNTNNIITDGLYSISATWLGVLLFLLIGFALVDLIVFGFKLAGINLSYKIAGNIMLSLVLIITLYSLINAEKIQVTKVNFEFDNLKKDIKIVQLSDIHVGVIHSEAYLKKIVNATNKLNPDFVLITGDLFDGEGEVSEKTIAPLKDLKSKYGVYFVTGNHENYFGLDKSLELVRSQNITVLRNEEINVDGIQLIGQDYPLEEFGNKTEILKGINVNKSKVSVFMYHDPAGFKQAAEKGISLQLSGHIHKGQILPFELLERIFIKYVSGTYESNNSYLFVSQGVGTWGPPMRFGSKSEIVEIDLKVK